MLKQITDEEIEFMECFYNPICQIECLFHDVDALSLYDEEKFGEMRLGQLSMLSYEYMVDLDYKNPDLSDRQNSEYNMMLREGAGTVYALGGRNYGKTICVEKVDVPIDALCVPGDKAGFSSYDASHIEGILEDVCLAFEQHPILKDFLEARVKRSPQYTITAKNGWKLTSVNMNITGKKPGGQFYQKHFTKLWIEEASFETNEVYKKRLDSRDELGCVIRAAGMTNFTKHTPCGKIWNTPQKWSQICNLPQYVNPNWNDTKKQDAIREHGGEESITYRIYVKGHIVEDGISVFDMTRVRKCYLEDKAIKHFEVTKDNFDDFKNFIIIDRPPNAEVTYECSDVGETAATEIIIIFKIKDKYRYSYNITAYNLTDEQQYKLMLWVARTIKANFVGLDTTDQLGRAIFRRLSKDIPRENLVWVGFNEKIGVDYEEDENGNQVYKDGKEVLKEEYVSAWSVKRNKDLLYSEQMIIPMDYKFDVQFNSVIAMQSGNRTVYKCTEKEDHLFAAFRVFAIAEWSNLFNLIKPVSTKKFCKAGV